MRYKLLGKSGLRVSELCLGTMTFGEEWGWGASKNESRQIFDAYAAAGGNFIDTANMYTNGTSEKMVGEFVAGERDRFVIATKYTFPLRDKDPNSGGNHRKSLTQSLERSLRNMKLDYVDLLWVHAWDPFTPVEELMRALDDQVRGGKVLYIGVSDFPAWKVSHANTLAELRGWTPFIALQIEYSLVERTPERDLIPMARAFGLAVTPWSPLGGGVLSGKYNNGSGPGEKDARLKSQWTHKVSERNLAIASAAIEVARQIGRTPSQVALAWIRAQGPDMIPILGARKLAQIRDNLGCTDVTLTPAQLERLNQVSRIDLGFPHHFLADARLRQMLNAGCYDLIDKDRIPGLHPTVSLMK
jgi:aryl-alcohol dehydrogenase-like predicted oxidoreductase